MTVIARQGTRVLTNLGHGVGRVVDEASGQAYPPMPIISILARGYWQPVPVKSDLRGRVRKHLAGQHNQLAHGYRHNPYTGEVEPDPWAGPPPRKVHVHKDELPAELYHATTNLPAVLDSGYLRASGGMGGGLGSIAGESLKTISMTTSREMAEHIARELRRIAQFAQGKLTFPDGLSQIARQDEQRWGLPAGTLDGAVEESLRNFEVNRQAGQTHGYYLGEQGARDLAAEIYSNLWQKMRESAAHQRGVKIEDPVIFLGKENRRRLDPDKIGVVKIATSAIPDEAVLYTGPDNFLFEVRSEGDWRVPINGDVEFAKHLPGEHEQKTHNPYKGKPVDIIPRQAEAEAQRALIDGKINHLLSSLNNFRRVAKVFKKGDLLYSDVARITKRGLKVWAADPRGVNDEAYPENLAEALREVGDVLIAIESTLPGMARLLKQWGPELYFMPSANAARRATYINVANAVAIWNNSGESVMHELGHWLDAHAGGAVGVWDMKAGPSPAATYSADPDPVGQHIQAVVAAVRSTPAWQAWQQDERVLPQSDGSAIRVSEYLTWPHEVFARAVEQYLYLKSFEYRSLVEYQPHVGRADPVVNWGFVPEAEYRERVLPAVEAMLSEFGLLKMLWLMVKKHLPGRHEQLTHGQRGLLPASAPLDPALGGRYTQARQYFDHIAQTARTAANLGVFADRAAQVARLEAYGLKLFLSADENPQVVAGVRQALDEIETQLGLIKRHVPNLARHLAASGLRLFVMDQMRANSATYSGFANAISIEGSRGESFAHEVAHWLDHYTVGTDGQSSLATASGWGEGPVGQAIRDLVAEVRSSPFAQQWSSRAARNQIVYNQGEFITVSSYLQEPAEVFARSFSQFIVSRTPDFDWVLADLDNKDDAVWIPHNEYRRYVEPGVERVLRVLRELPLLKALVAGALKHLPAQHDQTTHGWRHGRQRIEIEAVPGLAEWIESKDDRWYPHDKLRAAARELLDSYDNWRVEFDPDAFKDPAYRRERFVMKVLPVMVPGVREQRNQWGHREYVDSRIEDDSRYSDEIPPEFATLADQGDLFRGMQHEELEAALERGYFKSTGTYNFSNQENQTLLADNPRTASSYAGGFAPVQHKPTFDRPGYVVAFKRGGVNWSDAGRGSHEWYTTERIPLDLVDRVLEARLYQATEGYAELHDTGYPVKGAPGVWVRYRDVTDEFKAALGDDLRKRVAGMVKHSDHDQKSHGNRARGRRSPENRPSHQPMTPERLVEFMNQIAEMHGDRVSDERLALKYGRTYPQQPLTDPEAEQLLRLLQENQTSLTDGARECYGNAWRLAMAGERLGFKYIEGFGDSMGILPMQHAWVEWKGKVIDLTWGEDIGNARRKHTPEAWLKRIQQNAVRNVYHGYEVPLDYVVKFMLRNQTTGPMTQDPGGDFEIYRTGQLPWLVNKHDGPGAHPSDPAQAAHGGPTVAEPLREQVAKHLAGGHDQERHGDWAGEEAPAAFPDNWRSPVRWQPQVGPAAEAVRAIEAAGMQVFRIEPALTDGLDEKGLSEVAQELAVIREVAPALADRLQRSGLRIVFGENYSGGNAEYSNPSKAIFIHGDKGESVMHELGHWLDADLVGQAGTTVDRKGWASHRLHPGPDREAARLARQLVVSALGTPDGRGWKGYWRLPTEVFARLLDQYFFTKSETHQRLRRQAGSDDVMAGFFSLFWLPPQRFEYLLPDFDNLMGRLNKALRQAVAKHLPGAHEQSRHGVWARGRRNKSGLDLSRAEWRSPENRVWQGRKHEGNSPVGRHAKLKIGTYGEEVAVQVLHNLLGGEFTRLSKKMGDHYPLDVLGDSLAVEVKSGWATNTRGAQHWRVTLGEPGEGASVAAQAILDQIADPQARQRARREFNRRAVDDLMQRKASLVEALGREAGRPLRQLTVGVIFTNDRQRVDVFAIPGFHRNLEWNRYATDDYYIGTYDLGAFWRVLGQRFRVGGWE